MIIMERSNYLIENFKPLSWHDIPYRKYVAYLESDQFAEITSDNVLDFLSYWTDVEAKELGNLSMLEISVSQYMWLSFLKQPEDFGSFSKVMWDKTLNKIVLQGQVFYYPETVPNLITDAEQPLYNESFGDWLEAMQFTKYYNELMEDGSLKSIPAIMALLFRKKNESVPIAPRTEREKWIKRRIAVFESAPMYYIWQALFFFIMPTRLLLEVSRTYFQKTNQQEIQVKKYKKASKQ